MSLFGRLFGHQWVRRVGDAYEVRLPPSVHLALVGLADEIDPRLDDPSSDPSLHRLFPPAHTDDVLAEAAWQIEQGEALVAARRAALDAVRRVSAEEPVDEEALLRWMEGINAIRLVLAARLDLDGDDGAEAARLARAERDVDSLDPDVAAAAQRTLLESSIYELLSLLVDEAVEALSGTL